MTGSPFPSLQVRRLARELIKLRADVRAVVGALSVAAARYSSLDGGTWLVKDTNGTVRQQIGAQGDGSYTSIDRNGPAPASPSAPTVTPLPGGLKVTWGGTFTGGTALPVDLRWIEVHVDLDPAFTASESTRDAAISSKGPGSVTFTTDDYVPHTVRLMARNTSGVPSEPSGAVTATPLQVRAGDIGPGEVGTVNLDDGAVTPPKSGTGVTSNLVPDPGFNDAGWRAKRAAPPWGFVDAASVGFASADWAAYCAPTTTRAALVVTGTAGVPVIAGEVYFIGYDAARSAAGAGQAWVEVVFYDSTGAVVVPTSENQVDPLLTEVRDIASLPTATFDTRDGQITIPPKTASMRVQMVRQDPAGASAGSFYLDRLEVRSVVSRASQGQRVETSPSGVVVFDANGSPIGSIAPDGSLSMVTGQFNDSLTYKGTEVGDLLDQRARGEIARVDGGYTASPATTGEVVWLEFEFTAVRGRSYKLRSSGLTPRGIGMILRARYTVDGTRPLITSPQLANVASAVGQTLFLASDIGGLADSGDKRVRLFLDVVSGTSGTSGYLDPADPALGFSAWVEDTGPRQVASGGVVTGGGTGGTGSTTTTKTFTTQYNATWSRAWADKGFRGNAPMYQGYYDATWGNNFAAFGFNYNQIAADLAGATIKKLEVYLYAEHWYYAAGGQVWLGTTGLKGPPGNNIYPADAVITRANWHLGKPEGRWVDLGAVGVTIGNELKAGTTGGFVLDARHPKNNLNDYGRITGAGGAEGSTSPGLRITYSKAV